MYYTQAKVKNRDRVVVDRVEDGSSVGRKEYENNKRAVQQIWDYARSNKFEWWVTLTLNPAKVDRFDYDACAACIIKFTRWLRDHGGKWLIVPEQHLDGAYHFHGLVSCNLKLKRGVNPYTGKPKVDRAGRPVYNLTNYDWGWSTVVPCDNAPQVASYLAKYITKGNGLSVPKGRNRYWPSRNLNTPYIEYTRMTSKNFMEILNISDYQKLIESPYGSFIIAESHGKGKDFFDYEV